MEDAKRENNKNKVNKANNSKNNSKNNSNNSVEEIDLEIPYNIDELQRQREMELREEMNEKFLDKLAENLNVLGMDALKNSINEVAKNIKEYDRESLEKLQLKLSILEQSYNIQRTKALSIADKVEIARRNVEKSFSLLMQNKNLTESVLNEDALQLTQDVIIGNLKVLKEFK